MDNVLAVFVPTESAAEGVVKALQRLDEEGSIELYAATMVSKSNTGVLSTRDMYEGHQGLGASSGASTGALIGLLGGPMGAAIGAAAGGATGTSADLIEYSGFSGRFLDNVTAALQPGRPAIIASIQEDFTEPVDRALAPLGASIFRQAADDLAAARVRSDVRGLKDELVDLDVQISRAAGEARAKLEARRQELHARRAARLDRLRARAAELQQGWDAKIASVREKVAHSRAEARSRHEQRAAALAHHAAAQKAAFQDLFRSQTP
jgi:uncharacterized membrane protein